MRTESEFLIDVLARLNQAAVDYMLTGSMASNYWGIPRTTHDLDFVVVIDPEQVDRFVAPFRSGLFIQEESVRSAFHPPFQFNVLDELSALKADFWMLRDDEFEQTAFRRRISVGLFGVFASIATPEDVLLHKLYWNRLTPSQRQLHDAAGIFAVQGETLDREYLERWAGRLNVEQAWNDIESGRISPKST
jgi:hypothetical protein